MSYPSDPVPAENAAPVVREKVDRLELVVAVLLGLAATLTAWAAFQGSLAGGDSQKEFTKATLSSSEAGQWYDQGTQQNNADQQQFIQYVIAAQDDDSGVPVYLRETVMDDNLVKAIEWWEKQPDDGADTPFDDVEGNPYTIEQWDKGEEMEKQAASENERGEFLDEYGDKFDGVTVLLATALFLFGIAAVFRGRKVRIGTLGVGAFLLFASAVRLVDLGVYQWTA
ncbi:hypothetical protein AB0M54_29935 [Actinoplanes sp. NPDC051470]|uniref:hypothetical protein n=1 Tax=unclassified Actinoplanes TaxID=2626549 RepID=UPI003446836D